MTTEQKKLIIEILERLAFDLYNCCQCCYRRVSSTMWRPTEHEDGCELMAAYRIIKEETDTKKQLELLQKKVEHGCAGFSCSLCDS